MLSGADYQASCRDEGYVKVTREEGVISSLMVSQLAANSGGLHGCPWLIVVQPGQRVNITLMDFGPEIESDHRPTCHKYGIIRERGVDSHTTGESLTKTTKLVTKSFAKSQSPLILYTETVFE